MQVSLAEAETQLPRLIRAALAGDEVIIAERGRPSVRLVPVQTTTGKRRPGAWSHLAPPAEDWDSPAFNREIARDLMGGDDFSSSTNCTPWSAGKAEGSMDAGNML
jgi:prevent-host-death family protein